MSVNIEYSASIKSQEVEYQTLPSDYSASKIERPERLHEWLRSEEIELLHLCFQEKQKLSYAELREELEQLSITFSDLEFNRLFLKINQNRDFKCDWNEFISYLILGFQEDDPSAQKEALILPMSSAPLVKKSEHRSAVCCIGLLKIVSDSVVDDEEDALRRYDDEDDIEEENDENEEEPEAETVIGNDDSPALLGVWITASREGQIRLWTPFLDPIRTGMSESSTLLD